MSNPKLYRLTFDKTFKKQVNQLPGKLRQEAKRRIADLARNPRPAGAIELRVYPNMYRTWLTDARYRLIWEVIDDEASVVLYYVGLKPDYESLLGPPLTETPDDNL